MNILITGTSTGFGNLMVRSLASDGHGHNVIATMRGVSGKNAGPAAELSALPNVEVVELDVTDQSQVNAAVGSALERHGRIDVLVNNAGVFGNGLLEAYSIEQIQKLFDINVYGPLRMMKAVLPSMRANQDGLIINVSSSLGLFTIPLAVPYCASKHALEGFVSGSYKELMQLGIENILLEPGAFPTELAQKAGVDADEADTIASYNGLQDQMNAYSGEVMAETMSKAMPDPKDVSDKAVELIHMEKGSRPLRSFVDAISGRQLTSEVESTLADLERKWVMSYGYPG